MQKNSIIHSLLFTKDQELTAFITLTTQNILCTLPAVRVAWSDHCWVWSGKVWQTVSPGCLFSLHYQLAGSAGWLVHWVTLEHTACQLHNRLTDWLPAWLHDDLTYNLPSLITPTTHGLDSLDVTFMGKSSTRQKTWQPGLHAMHHSVTVPPAAMRSLLSQRNQYHPMIKLAVAYIGCKGLAKFTKGAETMHDFCWTSAAESCQWGGVDGCEAAEPKHRSSVCIPVPTKGQFPENWTSAHFVPHSCQALSTWLSLVFNHHIHSFFLSLLSNLHHRHLHHDSV